MRVILGIKHLRRLQNVFGLWHSVVNGTRGFWKALNITGLHTMFGWLDWVLLYLPYLLQSSCLLYLHLLLFIAICPHT